MPKENAHAELKATALALYGQIAISRARGFDAEKAALDAFRLAHAFEAVSASIESGEMSAEPPPPDKPEFVDVPRLVQSADEKWHQALDPVTERPIVDSLPVDRDAYAPNLPENHPINLRFKPRDGVKRKMQPALQLN